MSVEKSPEIIKIRLNLREEDPLYKKFNAIKEKTAISANTEVIRYAIKKTFDNETEECT